MSINFHNFQPIRLSGVVIAITLKIDFLRLEIALPFTVYCLGKFMAYIFAKYVNTKTTFQNRIYSIACM